MATIDVNTARGLSTLAVAASMTMVDAPASGGVPGAEAATLTFMVGGEDGDVIRARAILEAMGGSIVHVGPAGAGQAAKICNNMILGFSVIAVAKERPDTVDAAKRLPRRKASHLAHPYI